MNKLSDWELALVKLLNALTMLVDVFTEKLKEQK